ncbi:hypothetical protein XH80_30680 [Bradyrhizobium sp. CCBAU 45384]|nr:hypothetical protein [Bradyrhizobium sp. CCBAU 45384]
MQIVDRFFQYGRDLQQQNHQTHYPLEIVLVRNGRRSTRLPLARRALSSEVDPADPRGCA